ncbi:MAG: GNAT family N-acetyltransferase [Acidimicrobiales bacterium]
MNIEDQISVCAAGESAWHAAAYAGLGAEWREEPGWAWGPGGPPHRFLLTAVTLEADQRPPPSFSESGLGILRDSWAVCTVNDLPGWTSSPTDPWMVRDPGTCEHSGVDGVEVRQTSDELLFERAAFVAAGGSPPAVPGELHPRGSSRFPGLHLFLAWRDEVPIGTAIAVRHETGVVVSGVAVIKEERRKGIGALLTTCAVRVDHTVPATLTATELGIGTYRELGFRELISPVHWSPPRSGT